MSANPGIIYKCEKCNNILGTITGESEYRVCGTCSHEQAIREDRLICTKYYGEPTRIITPEDVKLLGFEKTTKTIEYQCPDTKCSGNIMAIVHDDNLVTSLFCRTCANVFQKK